jgi:alkylation response protein AidB-like acyl-CoA dehydrogenase
MNFELTDEQKDIKKSAREFAEGMFPEVAEECDLNETFPRALWKKACDLGFVGVFIDEAYFLQLLITLQLAGPDLFSLEFFIHLFGKNVGFWKLDTHAPATILSQLRG